MSGYVIRIEDVVFYMGYGGIWISNSITDVRKTFLYAADRWQSITVWFCHWTLGHPNYVLRANLGIVHIHQNPRLVRNVQL